jgi:diguanylate cyclase (GGDEF)-like protein
MTDVFSEEWLIAVLVAALIALVWRVLRLRRHLDVAIAQLRDLSQKLESYVAQSKRLAGVDPLTKLANRGLFDETLQREWQRAVRTRQPLGIIMADIDRFKAHNDLYGHQSGDECIRQVAAVLKRCVRGPTDLVARYGGEEFAVILPGADAAGAMAVAERMRRDVEAIKLKNVNNVVGHDVTVSLGVAAAVPETGTPHTLVAAADEALYRAKAVGRNQVIVADADRDSMTIPL